MTLRIAQVGLGRWARAHAAAAQRSERVEIVTCFSRDRERREAFAREWSIPRAAPSFEDVLADPGVDAVIVSTPNDLHVEMTLAAMGAGKAVLVDKPVATNVAQGLPVLRALDGAATVGVAHHARRLGGHRAMQHWCDSGEAGAIRVIHATFSNPRGVLMAPDAWHRTAAGAEAGVLIQVGIHQIDNVLALVGPALTVSARFEYGELGPAMPVTAMVTMSHTGGALSAVSSSWTTPSHYRFDVEATGGNMEFRLDHGHWTSGNVDAHGELVLEPAGGERALYAVEPGDPLRDELDDLAAAVSEPRPYVPGVVDGLRAMAVVEAAVRSAAGGGAALDVPSVLDAAGATPAEIAILQGQ